MLTRRRVCHAIAALIVVYGALLRLDAFVGKYGTLDHPGWARVMTHDVAPIAARLRPASIAWTREARPYVGGDPITYLAFARAMTSFYQPHVREPVFLAMTRGGLFLVDDQDAGISLASAVGSILVILGVYLAGSSLLSPAAGLVAALLMAMEYEAITWAPDGWRDDPFTAAVVFTAWALSRVRQQPSFWRAVVAGLLAGIACLTRITAVSFIVPALVWLVLDAPLMERRARLRAAGIALLIATAVVGPFLVSCAIATGDPFIAINYHTKYYRHSEGLDSDKPMAASSYIVTKLGRRPFATADTAFNGLFVQPFATKWRGLEPWVRDLGTVASWLSLVGLAVMLFFAAGRLMLVILLTSLIPYIFTWNIGGGSEWRFTMHAYPFYLLASALVAVGGPRVLGAVLRARGSVAPALARAVAWKAGSVGAVALLGAALYFVMPWFVVREAIAHGESTSVETSTRDLLFYRDGWSDLHTAGITARVSVDERAVVQIPLPQKRSYDIVLRMDPVAPGEQQQAVVLFNRRMIGTIHLGWNPERVGAYRLHVPEQIVNAGRNELTIVSEKLVPAANAGPRFSSLDPAARLGVRLWYVRVVP